MNDQALLDKLWKLMRSALDNSDAEAHDNDLLWEVWDYLKERNMKGINMSLPET